MQNSFTQIIPIFLIALLGGILRRKLLNINDFWRGLEKMSYFILTPTILFNNIATSNAKAGPIIHLIIILISATILVSIFLIYYNFRIEGKPKKTTCVLQANLRFNNYMFLGLGQALYYETGLEIAAIVSSYMIIFSNFATVCAYNFYLHSAKNKNNFLLAAKKISTNPMIISSMLGVIFNIFDLEINEGIKLTLNKMSNMGITVGLLIIGASLRITFHKEDISYMMQSNIAKLIIMPIITILMCILSGINTELKHIAVLYACMPVAGSSYIIAKELGGDEECMKSIITSMIMFSLLSLTSFTYIILKI